MIKATTHSQLKKKKQYKPYHKMYSSKWRKAADIFLRQHPICCICQKSCSEVVDHITDHKGNLTLFWDITNWQALCKHCHDSKTYYSHCGKYRLVKKVGEGVELQIQHDDRPTPPAQNTS